MKIDFGKLRFLVVDDNRFMRDLTRVLLGSLGARAVFEATNGAEALELFRENAPDIVLLDLVMPVMDGLETLRHLRDERTSANPYVAVIVVSAYSERARVLAARDAGATEYIVKPVSAAAIHARVSSVVLNPRPFVETKTFFGPDRRRAVNPAFADQNRRSGDIGSDLVRLIDDP